MFSWGIEPGEDTCMRLALVVEREVLQIEDRQYEHPNAGSQRALWRGFRRAAEEEGLDPWDATLVVHMATGDVCLVSLDTEVEKIDG
jgi:hypothetical protein